MVSLDVYIELPEIAWWHILAYFIHISNAWLTGLKSPNVNQEQNRGLGVLVPKQRMNHHCWQSVLGQRCLSRGFEWPSLFLLTVPRLGPTHKHTLMLTQTPPAPSNTAYVRSSKEQLLAARHVDKKGGGLEPATWRRSLGKGLKMSPLAFHSQC